MDALLLSRIQFGFTIGFHVLFPTLTIGLAWFLVFFEAAWLRTRRPVWLRLYRFWVRIFALAFGMGVVSGLVLSYQIGTNFSRFSEFTGPVLGPLLSAEVLTAFFVEAGSFPCRLAHMLLAAFISTALVVAGASAWHLRRNRHRAFAGHGLRSALAVLAVATPLQVAVGDLHGLQVQRHQPLKVAAMEALWQTRARAPLVLFAWPDPATETNRWSLEIPALASVILQHVVRLHHDRRAPRPASSPLSPFGDCGCGPE